MNALLRLVELAAAHAPAERASERFWLFYTPFWGLPCGVIMLGGFAEQWGDAALMALGVVIAVPALIGPMWSTEASPRSLPFSQRTGVKMACAVAAFSLLLNYTQTPFFFDVLHAHFGFHTSWTIRNNPFFLYLMTIPYFCTYSVLLSGACRLAWRTLRATWARYLGAVCACVVIACLESVFNANPWMRHLYCFDEYGFAIWFGSLAYGIAFVCIVPVWLAVERLTLTHALVGVLAAVYADSLLLDVLRYHVAPHLTVVQEAANGMDRTIPSCLHAP